MSVKDAYKVGYLGALAKHKIAPSEVDNYLHLKEFSKSASISNSALTLALILGGAAAAGGKLTGYTHGNMSLEPSGSSKDVLASSKIQAMRSKRDLLKKRIARMKEEMEAKKKKQPKKKKELTPNSLV